MKDTIVCDPYGREYLLTSDPLDTENEVEQKINEYLNIYKEAEQNNDEVLINLIFRKLNLLLNDKYKSTYSKQKLTLLKKVN